jgi:hypothetical protein
MMTNIHMVPSLPTIHHHHGTNWPYALLATAKAEPPTTTSMDALTKKALALDQQADAVFHVPEKSPVCV